MKYLYTNEPDEGCHKVNGVYGRPVHTSEQATLKAKGWKELPDELREEEGREEAEEEVEWPTGDTITWRKHEDRKTVIEESEDLAETYEEVIGKKPHHKMKAETMKAKIDEALSDD